MVLSFVITFFPPVNIQKITMWELIITLARITEQFSLLWQELKYIVYIRVWFFFWQYWRSRGSYLLWMCCTTELYLQLSARMFEGSFYEKSLYGGTQKMPEHSRSGTGKLLSACDIKDIPHSELGLWGGAAHSKFAWIEDQQGKRQTRGK